MPTSQPDPKISIITACLNGREFLEQALLSIISQDYPRVEYIVLDGGSTDGSVEIIKRYADRLAFWESRKDGGQVQAIARGLALCTGTIVGWLNADDLLLPGALRAVADAASANPSAAVYAGSCVLIDGNGVPFKVHRARRRHWRTMVMCGHGLAQMSSFWSRSVYDSVGGLDLSLSFAFDYDLFVKLSRAGGIHLISQYLSAFRVHPTSKTSTQGEIRKADDLAILGKYVTSPVARVVAGPVQQLTTRIDPVRRVENWLQWRRDEARLRALLGNATGWSQKCASADQGVAVDNGAE